MVTEEEIVDDFDTYGITLTASLVEKCLALCIQYEVSGEQIAACWLGFAASNGHDELKLEYLEHFEREELAKKKKTSTKRVKADPFVIYDVSTINSLGDDVSVTDDVDDDLLAAYTASPAPDKRTKGAFTPDHKVTKQLLASHTASPVPITNSPSASTPSQRYSSRKNAGQTVASFGNAEGITQTSDNYQPRVNIVSSNGQSKLTAPYKYMFSKVRDIAEVLDETINNLADSFKEHLNIEEWSHLDIPSTETSYFVGRVCCDSVGRLNAVSVLLEGSREICGGNTVPLDLSHLHQYSLFPGQIVGVRGANTTGKRLVAEELISGLKLPLPISPVTMPSGGLEIVVASGPFTTTDNLLYEPLNDFLEKVAENPPHLLILIGPLLDSAHPLVSGNMLTEPFDAVSNRCLQTIVSAFKSTHSQLVLVSSSRDINGLQVYPAAPYKASGSFLSVSDPAFLDVDGILIAITATDVLFQLGKEEISFPPQSSDRFSRLSRHLLMQQSMYPLYPSPEGTCIDVEQTSLHASLPATPHIMLLPSDLKCFIKEVDECVVINPEHLAKGVVGGSFARLQIGPAENVSGSLAPFMKVEIVKV